LTAFHVAILAAYFVLLGLFSIYGLHKYWLVYLFYRHGRKRPVPSRRFADEELPRVTVQLPVYNEMYVVERVLDAAAQIRYPRDRFEIQVLDDSTDETTGIARRKAEELREQGLDVTFLHRDDRRGFKAGALEAGMEVAKGEFFAIFDADFLPGPDFLEKTIHHFTNEGIGLVQMRWDHLNRRTNFLTNVTSIYLDGHFIVESTSRSRSGSFVNFHGTAGIWRKQAILDAGGWEHDTLTEDLDLSYRSQLAGWRFVYLMEEGTPAELPAQMTAFKAQQHRWAKGAIQTMRKVLPLVFKADLPLRVKIEATFHLAGNFAYIFMIAMLMLMLPAMIIRLEHDLGMVALVYDLSVFILVTASFFCFYLVSQLHGDRNWRDTIRYTPFLMGMGIGLAVNNTRAVLEALAGQTSPFVRTPKLGLEGAAKVGASKYRARRSFQPLVELALGAYFLVILFTTIHYRAWMGIPFTVLFLAGFVYIGTTSLMEGRRRPVVDAKPA
jgi:cellulose synthase/poly-beta-1,6-N-acetylglucosamine synthase-like glycosyltransferase